MKKLIIILISIVFFTNCKAQVVIGDIVIARDEIRLGDSAATTIYSGTLINEDYFQQNAIVKNAPYIDFDTTLRTKL